MAKCEICSENNGSVSAVIDGEYYKHVCSVCKGRSGQVSSGHARWARDMDIQDHEFDLAQPYNADGTPNATFIKAYPEQSAAVFTKEQMDKAIRS